jgi:hypothetical protein
MLNPLGSGNLGIFSHSKTKNYREGLYEQRSNNKTNSGHVNGDHRMIEHG